MGEPVGAHRSTQRARSGYSGEQNAEDRVAPQEMELTLVNQHEFHPVVVAANAAFQRIGSLNTTGQAAATV